MPSLTYALPPLPGFDSPKTFAAWRVWHDSTTEEVRFSRTSKKDAARRCSNAALSPPVKLRAVFRIGTGPV